ncbi:MAG: PEP-CTERM sorting domain-containing protein [Acidobacteria bacterium]|nr:PEP-CTERM sorting domain-containing protein [Acidobacteriota bacterium]
MKRRLFYAVILVLVMSVCSFGDTIGLQTDGNLQSVGGFYGFAFTTPSGGPWNNIFVNYFSDSGSTTPFAQGNLFLFNSVYTGTPEDLAASAYSAQSTGILGGQWDFSDSVVLQASTQYFFYSDADTAPRAIYGGAAIPNGWGFWTSSSTTLFNQTGTGSNFLVEGDVIPEPGTLILLSTGLGALGLAAYRRRKK